MKKRDISILAAGLLWGTMGLFTRRMGTFGVDSGGVLVIRSCGCAVLFALAALLRDPKLLKIRLRDLWLFVCYGVAATFFFTYCYYQSIALGSMAAACTLLYSAPVFVMVMSLFVFHERFSRRKLAALLCSVTGCALVSGLLEGQAAMSLAGTVYGLLAGVGYALYSVFSKSLTDRDYNVLTVNAYGWIFCSAAGLLVFGPGPAAHMFAGFGNFAVCAGIIVVAGFLPALLYSWGLAGVEAGKGAVMASMEPVTASVLGFLVYRETPTPLGLAGIVLVLAAVVILNIKPKEN